MKKVLLACVLSLGTFAVLQAQDSTATQSDTYVAPATTDQQDPAQEKDGKEIASADLPAPIQEKLKSTDYSGWTVDNAKTKVKKDGKTCYVVELKNASEKKKVVFDEQGNIEKEKE